MKSKVIDSTLALALLSAMLFTLGYAFDDAHLRSLHLPVHDYMPPVYLEIAKPFDLLFVVGQSDFKLFRLISVLIAGVGVVSSFWPRFRRGLVRVLAILRLIPSKIYVLSAAFGILALSNWLVNYGYTTADREMELARADWDDWTVTLKDRQIIHCHFAAASDNTYAVIIHDGAKILVQTIPKDAVTNIEHDSDVH